MSEKKLVCKGAIVECQFGDVPDTLLVLTQKKNYINDQAGSQKLIATDKELGTPFQAKTFGQCKLQPTGSSFKPCIPAITAWQGAFQKTQLKENQGYPLLEDSKATCAIAGSPCVKINFHGQVAEPSAQNVENTDEDITAQLLPQINPKIMKDLSPYDGLAVVLEGEEFKKQNREIDVEITTLKVTFVPLGIPDFNGNVENEYLKFNISITENPAEKMTVEVFKNGQTHYKEEITSGNMLGVGNHEWKWDGFDNYENYNSKALKEDDFEVEAKVWLDGQEKSHKTKLEKTKPIGKDWVDVDIQRNLKSMIVTLRINLRDGGERGLDGASNIPKSVISYYGHPPIASRTLSFADLRKDALKGIETYWSRNDKSRAKKTMIKGENWSISVKAEQSKGGMDAPKLIFFTNKILTRFNRSHNFPGSRILYYKTGYLFDKDWKETDTRSDEYKNKGWFYLSGLFANSSFKATSAHEIGHQILLAYGGALYSAKHKGTSTIWQNPMKGSRYKEFGEIDIMEYADEDRPSNYFSRIVVAEKDLLSTIWLTKLKIK
ncbi:DUF4280 domain-containing protein [Aequorivita capsosiphonis]|uniref:DUF4280 domain-containing protein n=1 Tax=Aequorivita capsosiphonis TaxID=487317 RepID=UPI0004245274|nr:DUF4280 domain-containing protein [Aequorivita capsosiphonis]